MGRKIKRLVRRIGAFLIPTGVRRAFAAILRSRLVLLCGGLYLVAVPTLFQVFPEWDDWRLWIRWLIIAIWFLVAAVVIAGTVRQGWQVENLVGDALQRRSDQRAI